MIHYSLLRNIIYYYGVLFVVHYFSLSTFFENLICHEPESRVAELVTEGLPSRPL